MIKKIKTWFLIQKLRRKFRKNELSTPELINLLFFCIIDTEIKEVIKKFIMKEIKTDLGK